LRKGTAADIACIFGPMAAAKQVRCGQMPGRRETSPQ
jgi:hypothetical protein